MNFEHIRDSRTRVVLGALAIVIVSAVFLCWGSEKIDPQSTFDSAFYHLMVDQIEKGEGFTEPIIWNFLNDYKTIDHPMDYWMPGGIIMYSLARKTFGVQSEIALNIAIWSFLAGLIFYRVFCLTGSFLSAFFAGLTFVFSGRNTFFLLTTDNIAFYAALGFLFFASIVREDRFFWLNPVIAGLAVLTRIEGILIAVFSLVYSGWRFRRAGPIILTLLLIVLTVLPWVIRNQIILGKPWTSNSRALMLTDYSDLFCPEFSGSLEAFLAQGWQKITLQRVRGLWLALINLIAIPGVFIVFYPYWRRALVSVWKREGMLFIMLLWIFVLFCGLIIPFQCEKGTALHISAFFIPGFSMLNGLGLLVLKTVKSNRSAYLIASIILIWQIFLSCNSIVNISRFQDGINSPYRALSSLFANFKDEKVVSNDPIRVLHETGLKGVMWSAKTVIRPEKIAETYECSIIIQDSRPAYRANSEPLGFEKIASYTDVVVWKKKKK
ncbi:MAG: hypothetical protein AB1403_22240 [Candidatus Riflebacteria bacterium]